MVVVVAVVEVAFGPEVVVVVGAAVVGVSVVAVVPEVDSLSTHAVIATSNSATSGRRIDHILPPSPSLQIQRTPRALRCTEAKHGNHLRRNRSTQRPTRIGPYRRTRRTAVERNGAGDFCDAGLSCRVRVGLVGGGT